MAALLAILDDEPTMSMFVFVGALGAGPKVLACRLEALERLKLAFEHGIDDAGRIDGNGIDGMGRVDVGEIGESSPLSEIGALSPLSAEGAVNAVLGILHTRLLEGSPLARRPLSELAGPLTAMIVLPYLGRSLAGRELTAGRSRPPGVSQRRPDAKARPKARARKNKRARLSPRQQALVAALQDGPCTVRELVVITGMSDQAVRNNAKGLEAREKIVKTELDGKIAYELPAKRGAAAGRKAAPGSSSSNGAGSSTIRVCWPVCGRRALR